LSLSNPSYLMLVARNSPAIQKYLNSYFSLLFYFFFFCFIWGSWEKTIQAQPIPTIPNQQPDFPNPLKPLPEKTLPPLDSTPPNSEDTDQNIILTPESVPGNILIKRFELIGNEVLTESEIAKIVEPYLLKRISLIELLEVPRQITQLYVDKGFITTSAIIFPQVINDWVVQIQIIPGTIEAINISGLDTLNPGYLRSRLATAMRSPVNQNKLLAALQLLEIDPLIADISAELSAGVEPNSSLLEVKITEAETFNVGLGIDNSQVISIGSFRQQISLNENNLTGIGDRFSIAYSRSAGSDALSNLSYELPINSRNGTIKLTHNRADNQVIQEPFDALNIENNTEFYELSFRQPVSKSVEQEFNIGLNFAHEASQTIFLDDEPFPNVTQATDSDGRTRVTTVGFFQDYLKRDRNQVLFLRSQFELGIDALDATIDSEQADGEFVSWQGYGEYIYALSRKNVLAFKGNIQFANDNLPSIKQFSAGGLNSVRGYPQNIVTGDNGLFFSTELRSTILTRSDPQKSSSQLTLDFIPHLDFGQAWNTRTSPNQSDSALLSLGAGLKLSLSNNLVATIDWSFPILEVDTPGNSLQANGIYFSIQSELF